MNEIPGWRKGMRYVSSLAALVVTAAAGVGIYTVHAIHAPKRRASAGPFTFSPWEVQIDHENVEFRTKDGVLIRGWWFPQQGNRVVVGCTGHRGAKQDLLGIGSALWRDGNNVLLFDFRGCGESDPAPRSLAHRELPDAQAAIEFARQRVAGARIGVIGYSMGASVAIMAVAEDSSVRALVADSPFATMRDAVGQAFRRRHLPVRALLGLSDAANRVRFGYWFKAVRPLDAIAKISPRPLLLIQGEDDRIIPVDHAYRLFAAAGDPKELWVVPGATHCGAYFINRTTYVQRVSQFFDLTLAD